jgi:hypothetical protein
MLPPRHFVARLPNVHVCRAMLARREQNPDIEAAHLKYGRHE